MNSSLQPFTIAQLLGFLERLDAGQISYTLTSVRPDAVMVRIDVPGERWEVEFMSDGWLDVEIFRSIGGVQDESVLERLFDEFST
jgi:hypothetical protein